MNEPRVVGVPLACADVLSVSDGFCPRERPKFLEAIVKTFTFNKLHGKVEVPLILSMAQDSHNIRMIEFDEGVDF